jgi:RNA polymerase sporulation-specific sigma factor
VSKKGRRQAQYARHKGNERVEVSVDEAMFAVLAEEFAPVIATLARRVYARGADYDDFRQAGMIGLWRAVLAYDDGYDEPFDRFAWWCIRREIVSCLRNATRHGERALDWAERLEAPVRKDDADSSILFGDRLRTAQRDPLEAVLERVALREALDDMSRRLSDMELRVALARAEGATQDAIAAWLDVGIKSVENALRRGRTKLAPSHAADELDRPRKRREAARLYKDGWSARQIAEALPTSTSQVYALLREAGVARRPRGTRPKDDPTLREAT